MFLVNRKLYWNDSEANFSGSYEFDIFAGEDASGQDCGFSMLHIDNNSNSLLIAGQNGIIYEGTDYAENTTGGNDSFYNIVQKISY